jgi:hypothetical protein
MIDILTKLMVMVVDMGSHFSYTHTCFYLLNYLAGWMHGRVDQFWSNMIHFSTT